MISKTLNLQFEKKSSNSIGNITVLVVLLLTFLSKNPIESFASIFLLYSIIHLFWKRNLPFVLCFCLVYQWIEIFTSILEANYFNQDLNTTFPETGRLAAWISMGGLFSIMVGLYLSVKKWQYKTIHVHLLSSARKLNIRLLYILYGLCVGANILIIGLSYLFPSIAQIFVHIINIKTIIYLVISYAFFVNKSYSRLYICITLFEFIMGLYSYFSSFKLVFIVLLISYATSVQRITFKQVLTLVPSFLIVFYILFTWQVVKVDYRSYLNKGDRQQNINVSFQEALSNLYNLAKNSTSKDYAGSIKATFRRLGYLEYSSLTLKRVPDILPYENGKLLLENLNFVFIPRFINPEKGIKDDSKKTSKYTGREFATSLEGSSFSLGYYTEFFIDFGIPGMFIPLLLFAFLVGKIFNRVMRLPYNLLLRYSIATVVLLPFSAFESDSIYLFGILFWGGLTHIFVFKILYRRIDKFIAK